jgi:hypothetical protein
LGVVEAVVVAVPVWTLESNADGPWISSFQPEQTDANRKFLSLSLQAHDYGNLSRRQGRPPNCTDPLLFAQAVEAGFLAKMFKTFGFGISQAKRRCPLVKSWGDAASFPATTERLLRAYLDGVNGPIYSIANGHFNR